MSYNLPIAGGRIIGFIPFPRVLVQCEMQSASSRIWTRVTVSISYDDNHYTTGTRKLMTMHKALHLRVDRLYVSREEGGIELAHIENCGNTSIREPEDYVKNSKGRIKAANNSTDDKMPNWTTKTKKQLLEEKQLNGYFKRQTGEISHVNTKTWLRKGNFLRETESLLIAAQKYLDLATKGKLFERNWISLDSSTKIPRLGYERETFREKPNLSW